MTVGAGIFWGCLFISAAIFFAVTKDRLSWGKYLRRTAIGGAVVLGILLLVGGGYWAYERYLDSRNDVITGLNGVSLGESKSDIEFRVGTSKFEKIDFVDSLKVSGDETFAFTAPGDTWVWVTFRQEKAIAVASICRKDAYYTPRINGIRCHDSGDALLERFGDGVKKWCNLHQAGYRAYAVDQFQVAYTLTENRVEGFLIGEDLPQRSPIAWKPCP